MADMDGSIIISEQLQRRLMQFQADYRIYNDMLLQWYKDVRVAIKQEGYAKAEIDMILDWYVDPDVLQLVEAAKNGKRTLKERIQKKKMALQARWGV
jgi:DNA-binding transcriptional MerR regulator